MEEEIKLADYIKIILKRKWIIIGIALSTLVASAILSFAGPETYKITTILEIGQMEEFIPESPNQLVEKIKNGNYDEAIKTKLDIKSIPSISISYPTDTRLVVMSINSSDPKLAKKVLDELENLILKEHQEKFNLQKNTILDDKKRVKSRIKSLENEKDIIEEKTEFYVGLVAADPSPTNQFFLSESKERMEEKKEEIAEQYLELNIVERQLNAYEGTHIIKKPVIPKNPSNNVKINISISLIIGLIISLVFVFGLEWWNKEIRRSS